MNVGWFVLFSYRQSVVVETQMTSVERVLDYCSLKQEPPAEVSDDLRPLQRRLDSDGSLKAATALLIARRGRSR